MWRCFETLRGFGTLSRPCSFVFRFYGNDRSLSIFIHVQYFDLSAFFFKLYFDFLMVFAANYVWFHSKLFLFLKSFCFYLFSQMTYF